MRADLDRFYPDERRRRRVLILRFLRWTAGILSVLLVIGVVTGFFVYRHLNNNLESLDPDLGDNRPSRVLVPGDRQPLNMLLIGSEGRSGRTADKHHGQRPRQHHDPAPYLCRPFAPVRHQHPARPPHQPARVSVDDGCWHGAPAKAAQFQTAYLDGGEGCVVRTVETMTNIRIDHFVVTSFDGFTAAADALDGVPISMPTSVYDPRLDVTIPAGRSEAKGDVALSYVTLNIDDSGDIDRIRRQQTFLVAMVNKALSSGTLANPLRLYGFLDQATEAVAVDEDLASLRKLADLMGEIRDVERDDVHFLTMPIAPHAARKERFVVGPDAAALWSRLRRDQVLTSEQLLGSSTSESGT